MQMHQINGEESPSFLEQKEQRNNSNGTMTSRGNECARAPHGQDALNCTEQMAQPEV
jgi:hypothetical protein